MFMDAKETLVIANSALFLTVNSAAYIPLAFVNIVRFLIQGALPGRPCSPACWK